MLLTTSSNLERITEWFFYDQLQLIELYLFNTITLTIIEDEDTINTLDSNFFTFDGTIYIKFSDNNNILEDKIKYSDNYNKMLKKLLYNFSVIDYKRYYNTFLEITSVIPAELEEKLFHLRNIRLSEKGFKPYHEAIGIYQPINIEKIKNKSFKILKKQDNFILKSSLLNINYNRNSEKNLFIKGIKNITKKSIINQIKLEFISLCNLIISADNIKIKTYNDLKKNIQKVNGYINIGIKIILKNKLNEQLIDETNIIKRCALIDIFRLGHSKILKLKNTSENWYNKSWFNKKKLKYSFWEEKEMGTLKGIMMNPPMFFENLNYSNNYCYFRQYEDIEQTKTILNKIKVIDEMYNKLKIDFTSLSYYNYINKKNLLLTTWVINTINNKSKNLNFHSIPMIQFKTFYNSLWEKKHNGKRKIKKSIKNEFLIWIKEKLKYNKLPYELNVFFDNLFYNIEDELNEVASKNLDPRFIKLFILVN